MTENPVTLHFDFTVKEAAEVFLEKKISVAPVVDEGGKIIGVIIKNDLFRVSIALKEWENMAYSSPLKWKTVPD